MTTETVSIHDIDVHCPVQDSIVYVPVKPICDALGIANQKQQEVLKNHPIYGPVVTLRVTTGGDGKAYEMLCIPLKYAFGWLMGIDARSVKPEAYETVIKYQEAAYDALYDRFFLEPIMQKRKLLLVLEQEAAIHLAEAEKRDISAKISDMRKKLEEIKSTEPRQLQLF